MKVLLSETKLYSYAAKYVCSVICILLFEVTCIPIHKNACAEDAPYNILITNDDGVESEGIAALAKALVHIGQVLVVAPMEDVSGASHSVTWFKNRIYVKAHHKDGELFGHSISGTPADAVRFGLFKLHKDKKISLVISGINKGENVGAASHFSGTVGAAMEATMHGIPAIAVSQGRRCRDFSTAAKLAAKVAKKIKEQGPFPGTVISINVPGGEAKGVVTAPMGGIHFTGEFVETKDDTGKICYQAEFQFVKPEGKNDSSAFLGKYITITPLKFDWTDYSALKPINDWNIGLD